MFVYEKKLQYPVRIKNSNPRLASVIISQYGGPYCNRRSFEIWPGSIGTIPAPLPCQIVFGDSLDTQVTCCYNQ